MRILHVINDLETAGAQKVVVDLAVASKKKGHKVGIGVLVYKETPFCEYLKNEGISVFQISRSNKRNDILQIRNLSKYMKNWDIVHSHLFPAQYYVSIAKRLNKKLPPIMTTEHSTTNRRRNKFPFKLIDSFIYQKYDEIICCSTDAHHSFQKSFPSIECDCIPNGVDVESIFSAEAYSKNLLIGTSENNCLIGMVARFDRPKRQDLLVEAISFLPSDFHAVFVGDGPSINNVKTLAQKLLVKDRCHFLGIRQDVGRILKTCDLTCLISEYEGLSLSSIECMASGHPFIGSNVNGIKPIVENSGVLVKNDSHELADAIMRVYESGRMGDIGEKCRKRSIEFSLSKSVDRYIDKYQSLLK